MSNKSDTTNRSSFTSKLGFVLAAAGSAVGLGNLWRFPYCAAKYGGGMFLLLYVILAVTFGFTLMVAEIAIGRKTKLSAIGAFDKLKAEYAFVGVLASLVPMIITPYYSVIGGWVLKFLWSYITMPASEVAMANAEGLTLFEQLITSPTEPILWFLIFLGATIFVIAIGVEDGIEKSSKILMPILVVLIAVVAIYSCTLPGAMEGIKYYMKPNLEDLSVKTILSAMTQLFYSLSLAMGIMITYGSYMKKDINIETSVWQIEIFDTVIAFLAGLAIIPAVFACGSPENLKAGPSLMFIILPQLFATMKAGRIIAIIFFFLVFFAALTSSISLYETCVSIIHDRFKQKRTPSIVFYLFICIIIGLLASLGYGPLSMITFLGMQFLDLFDFISNSVLMPIVAFFTCIFVGYVIKPKAVIDEVEANGVTFKLKNLFTVVIKYVAPILILIILIASILQAFGKISM
jgi:NSS family neurotransmitter:Na+ symporter